MANRATPISRKWTSGSRSQRLSACGVVKACSLDWVPDCPAGSATEGELIVRITLFGNCNALHEVGGRVQTYRFSRVDSSSRGIAGWFQMGCGATPWNSRLTENACQTHGGASRGHSASLRGRYILWGLPGQMR